MVCMNTGWWSESKQSWTYGKSRCTPRTFRSIITDKSLSKVMQSVDTWPCHMTIHKINRHQLCFNNGACCTLSPFCPRSPIDPSDPGSPWDIKVFVRKLNEDHNYVAHILNKHQPLKWYTYGHLDLTRVTKIFLYAPFSTCFKGRIVHECPNPPPPPQLYQCSRFSLTSFVTRRSRHTLCGYKKKKLKRSTVLNTSHFKNK